MLTISFWLPVVSVVCLVPKKQLVASSYQNYFMGEKWKILHICHFMKYLHTFGLFRVSTHSELKIYMYIIISQEYAVMSINYKI